MPDFSLSNVKGELATIAISEKSNTERRGTIILHLSFFCPRETGQAPGDSDLRKRNSGLRHNPGHAQNFLVFDVGNGRDDQPHIFQEFHFAQRGIGSQFSQRDLAGQLFKGAQIRDEIFPLAIMRVWVRIARDFRNRVERTVRRGMVAEYAVTLAHLLQRANGVGLRTCAMPHFLPFYEKGVPMIVMWVCGKDPVVSSRSRSGHLKSSAVLYTPEPAKPNKI